MSRNAEPAPRLDADAVRRDANGKWVDILSSLGVDKSFLVNRHGPCPICRDGRKRFRFDNRNGDGGWICNDCPPRPGGSVASGSGFDLLMGVNGWSFSKTLREVAERAGTARPTVVAMGRPDAELKAEKNALWTARRPLDQVPAAVRYFERRVGFVPDFPALRAHSFLKYPGGREYPAILARVVNAEGKPENIHRTWLRDDGQKADVETPRKVMQGTISHGSCIRLGDFGEVLGIAEGIETALSCTAMFGVPCWSAINAVLLENWTPPARVRVIVFGDNDESFHGQRAAFALAHRLRRVKYDVDVRIPDRRGDDWNDVHQRSLTRSAAA